MKKRPKPPPKPYRGIPLQAKAVDGNERPKKAAQLATPRASVTLEQCRIDAVSEVRSPAKGYPGSKNGSGVAEAIIAQMPPHSKYIELFAGHAAVFRRKRLATINWLIDSDSSVTDWLSENIDDGSVNIVTHDALTWLDRYCMNAGKNTLIYADPPYLGETRSRLFYQHEFDTHVQHEELLFRLRACRCLVMVSGYDSKLYSKLLLDWRRVDIAAMTRGGKRTECLWCNFPEPARLHDPRFAGGNFRERERIKRKRERWRRRFAAMPVRERQVIAEALWTSDPATAALAMRTATPEAAH